MIVSAMKPSWLHLLEVAPEPTEAGRQTLDPAEQSRARSFAFARDGLLWMSHRVALRSILAQHLDTPPESVGLACDPTGKPHLADTPCPLHFNLSHAGHFLAVVISTQGPVGVDLEPRCRAAELLGCEDSFCHPLELRTLPDEPTSRSDRLLELWTAKEAVLKAVGTGMLHPPQEIRIANGHAHSDQIPGLSRLRLEVPLIREFDELRLVLALPLDVSSPAVRLGRRA